MQELTGFNRRIADDLTAAGQPVTPANINHIRSYYGLKPTNFEPTAQPPAEGGGFFDIFTGSAAQGIAQTYDIGRLAEDKLGTDAIGGAAISSVISPLVPPGLSQPVGRALQAGLSKATGGAVDVGRLASQARSGLKDRFQAVADAPENQPRPGEEDSFTTNLAKAAGSSVGFIPAGAIGAVVGGPVGAAIAVGAQGAGMEGVSGYYEALEQTGDEEKAWTAFALKGALGATEGLDALVPVAGRLGKVLFAINRGTGGALSKGLAGITAKTLAAGAVQGAATNFLQEVGQEVGSNEVDKYLDLNPQTRLELLDAIKQYSWTVGAPSALLGTFFGGLEAKASQVEAKAQRDQYLESARVKREAQPTERVTVSTTPPGQIDPNAPPAQAEVDLAPEAPKDEAYQKIQSDTGDLTGEVEVPESLKPLAEFAAKRGFNLRAVTTREGSVFRGATMGKDILLNVNRPDDAIEYTFDHELSHGLKAKMGESWDTLRASIAEADPQGLAAWEEAAGDRQKLTEALRTEEGVGYYVENVLAPYLKAQRQSPEALAKIAQDDRTTFRKMVEGVLDIANEFGAGFNTYKAQIKKVLGDTGTVGKRMPPKRAVAIARQFSEAWSGLIDVAKNEAMVEAERVKAEEAAAQAKAEQRAAEIEQEYADVAATGQAAPTQGYSEAAMAQAVGEDLAEYAGKQGYAEIEAAARAKPLLLTSGQPTAQDQRRATLDSVREALKRGMSREAQTITEGKKPRQTVRPETKAEITARVARVKKMAARLEKRLASEESKPAKGPEKITATGVPARQQVAIPLESKEMRVERVANQQAAAMEAGMPDYEAAMRQEAQAKADAPGVEAMRTLGGDELTLRDEIVPVVNTTAASGIEGMRPAGWLKQYENYGVGVSKAKKDAQRDLRLDTILQDIEANEPSSIGKMASAIRSSNKFKSVRVRVFNANRRSNSDYLGFVRLNSGKDKADVILHEAAHAITQHELRWYSPSSKSGRDFLTAVRKYAGERTVAAKAQQSIIRTFLEAREAYTTDYGAEAKHRWSDKKRSREELAGSDPDFVQQYEGEFNYYLANPHEFVAGAMSDPKFQRWLNTKKSKHGMGTLWGRFVNAVRQMLGVPVEEGSILEAVLQAVDAATFNPYTAPGSRPDISPDVRYSLASTAHDALDRIKRSAPGWEKAFRARLVDYLTHSKEMLEKATGKKYQDIAAMRATLARRSKIAYRSAQELQTRIDKLAADLKRTGVKLEDLDSFLHARVAPIANAIVKQRRENDPNLSAINSGMSDEAAREIMAGFQKDPVLYKKLVELAKQFDDNNEHSLRTALKAQLISQEDFDAMRKAYDPATYAENGITNPEGFKSFYASMRDVPEPTDEYTSGAIGRNIGQGIGAMGKVYKARLGRRIATDETGAEVTRDLASPVANSFMDLQNNIIRSVKADEQRLYAKLVKDINDPTFGVVLDKIPTTEVLGQDGYVHTIPDPNWMGRPEILPFKENGKWRAIEFTKRTQRIALDLKTLTVLKPYESVAAVTRWYSGLLTRNNPGFMVKNFFRDLGWAALVAQSKYGSKFLSTMAGEYRSGMRDLWNAYRGRGESELLREYRASGAESTVYNLRDYEMTLKEMERLTRGGSSLDNFKAWWEKRIGGANDLIENGMRFAAFRAARRMGKTADEAMVYAKEGVSLNFEQTGEWGRRVSSLYAFFNAGMNGADALWRIVNSKDPAVRLRARQMMAMVAALGALNETLNRLLDYDDEDGTPLYDSISEFEKNRNAVALGPDGTFAKMPLPLGPNGFYAAGRNAVAVAFGAKTPMEAAADSIAFLSDTFNPFGSGPMQQMVAPTLMDPFVQWWSNQSFTGAKLAPDEEMFGRATKPPHELYWRNTGEIPKWIASALADMTPKGDSGFAYIDVRPDIIEHFAEAAFGGVGRSAYQVVDPAVRLATGEVPEAREVFGLRDFFGSATPYAVDKRYGEIREQADVAKARFKTLMEQGERQRALDWRKANAKLFAIEARIRTTERLLDRIPNTTENEARRRTLKANLVRTYHASTDQ